MNGVWESLDGFNLEGWRFYQQYRKCGKESCRRCATSSGHGPYWYKRDQQSGKVVYLGVELPMEVGKARARRDELKVALEVRAKQLDAEARLLLSEAEALRRIASGYGLTIGDRSTARAMGFGEALIDESGEGSVVQPGAGAGAQEGHVQRAPTDGAGERAEARTTNEE